MKKGDIVTVRAGRQYDLCTNNDLGGTIELPIGLYRVRLEKSWNDYEIGGRCIGTLLDEKDIAVSRRAGTTKYTPKKTDWQPERVYFATNDIMEKL